MTHVCRLFPANIHSQRLLRFSPGNFIFLCKANFVQIFKQNQHPTPLVEVKSLNREINLFVT